MSFINRTFQETHACFDQQLKNRLALNVNAILDFVANLLSDAFTIFQNKLLMILR